MTTKFQKEYIQFSKRVTSWGMTLMTISLMCCLAIIALFGLEQTAINAVVSLYTAFSAVLGIIVGAYQGNSSLEKYTRARYNYLNLFSNPSQTDQMENESPNG